MKKVKNILSIGSVLLIIIFMSCDPRVDLDEGQWGDHAFIDNVFLFTLQEEDHELNEFYVDQVLTTGIRRRVLNTSTEIDSVNAVATVSIPAGIDLNDHAIVFSHRSTKIEPLEGAPVAGIINDFSNGPFKYRLFSADGTERDWTVILQE